MEVVCRAAVWLKDEVESGEGASEEREASSELGGAPDSRWTCYSLAGYASRPQYYCVGLAQVDREWSRTTQ